MPLSFDQGNKMRKRHFPFTEKKNAKIRKSSYVFNHMGSFDKILYTH